MQNLSSQKMCKHIYMVILKILFFVEITKTCLINN
jgi:hypothetical protein